MKDFVFHDKPNSVTGRSFRVYGSAESLISDPGKAVLVASIAILAVVNVHVVRNVGFGFNSPATSVVLGDATQASIQSGVNPMLYRLHIKTVLRSYLEQRAVLEQDAFVNSDTREKWQKLVAETEKAVLDMKVPSQYKDMHLATAIALMSDRIMLQEPFTEDERGTWSEFLVQYPWVNNE